MGVGAIVQVHVCVCVRACVRASASLVLLSAVQLANTYTHIHMRTHSRAYADTHATCVQSQLLVRAGAVAGPQAGVAVKKGQGKVRSRLL